MQIFLIRHGETTANAARIVQIPETPLSERGLDQAELLADRLHDAGITRILSSDLPRAMMTAERLKTKTGATLDVVSILQERNFGDLRGKAYADLGVDIMAPGYSPPGGEGWDEFHVRVDGAWQTIRQALPGNAGNLAVVTHGLVCHSLALRHLRLPEGTAAPLRWDNASVTTIEASPPWRVALLNCNAHLAAATG